MISRFQEAAADPETVEGMYLEKRGDEAVLKRQKGPLALPEDEEDKARPPVARPTSPAFKQGHLGFKSSSSRGRAFGAVLGKHKGNAPNWLQQLRQRQRQAQAQVPPQQEAIARNLVKAEEQHRAPNPLLT